MHELWEAGDAFARIEPYLRVAGSFEGGAEGRVHFWVGGGIVWDSEPRTEVEESWVKARPPLAAVGAPLPDPVPA